MYEEGLSTLPPELSRHKYEASLDDMQGRFSKRPGPNSYLVVFSRNTSVFSSTLVKDGQKQYIDFVEALQTIKCQYGCLSLAFQPVFSDKLWETYQNLVSGIISQPNEKLTKDQKNALFIINAVFDSNNDYLVKAQYILRRDKYLASSLCKQYQKTPNMSPEIIKHILNIRHNAFSSNTTDFMVCGIGME